MFLIVSVENLGEEILNLLLLLSFVITYRKIYKVIIKLKVLI
jgi:hypothetical protein